MFRKIIGLSFTSLLLMLLFSSCKPERDTVDPVILLEGDTLHGINPYNVDSIGGKFSEPGYAAVDDNDGDITSRVMIEYPTILPDSAKSYKAIYTVLDNAKNVFHTYRIINIRNKAVKLEGSFIHDTLICPDSAAVYYQSTIVTSPTVNGDFSISNFANKGAQAVFSGHWENGNLTWMTPDSLHDADNTVIISETGGSLMFNPTRFVINFQMINDHLTNPISCTVKMYP